MRGVAGAALATSQRHKTTESHQAQRGDKRGEWHDGDLPPPTALAAIATVAFVTVAVVTLVPVAFIRIVVVATTLSDAQG